MLGILLWLIVGVLAVASVAVLSILCVPARISVMFDTQSQPMCLVKVALFGGLLPVISTAGEPQDDSNDRLERPASRRFSSSDRRRVTAFVPHMLREMPGLISKIARRVKLERVDARIRFGLSDPADTGIIYGTMIPILNLIGVPERSDLVLHPEFGSEVFDGHGHIGARFVPIALIAAMVNFAWATMVLPRISGVFR